MLEAQIGYVLQAVKLLDDHAALEVRQEAADGFHDEVQTKLRKTAWSAACHNWYKNADGKIVNNWCGSVEDYKAATARLNAADFELTHAGRAG